MIDVEIRCYNQEILDSITNYTHKNEESVFVLVDDIKELEHICREHPDEEIYFRSSTTKHYCSIMHDIFECEIYSNVDGVMTLQETWRCQEAL